ncbi:unnamed protein product, partial [Discosporangium mesarthrocarpum]
LQPVDFRTVYVGDVAKNEGSLLRELGTTSPAAVREGMFNKVTTSQYTVLNFIFKNLWEQFHRPANIYFLSISILQTIKAISITGGTPTTLVPLIGVLLVTGLKDALEDFQRHKADSQENNRLTARVEVEAATGSALSSSPEQMKRVTKRARTEGGSTPAPTSIPPSPSETVPWMTIRVGDVLILRDRDMVPADVVLLSSSGPKGLCHIMTANLDGETNLKPRQVSSGLWGLDPATSAAMVAGGGSWVECDLPNQKLEHFDGILELPGVRRISLDAKNILLRGCQLRNTAWVLGVVVYAGRDTKIQMNAGDPPHKTSSLKKKTDGETLHLLCVQVLCCLIGSIGAAVCVGSPSADAMGYLWGPGRSAPPVALTAFLKFWSFVIIFTNFIPISLLVTLDMVKFFQSKVLMWDRSMHHEVRDYDGKARRIPMQVRSSELNEELGMVEHIFSDKTGTLTCNVMDFRKCSIRGRVFGLGTTEIGREYRKRNDLPVPYVPLFASGEQETPHVNFFDPELSRVLRRSSEPLHEHVRSFFLHLALNHEAR